MSKPSALPNVHVSVRYSIYLELLYIYDPSIILLALESDELGGSATRAAPAELNDGAAEDIEGGEDDPDDKKDENTDATKTPFSHDALIFVMTFLCTEPLRFYLIATEAQPTPLPTLGPSNSDTSPTNLLAAASSAGADAHGGGGGGGANGRNKTSSPEDKKIAALNEAARNSGVSAQATITIARIQENRLAAEASEALVLSLACDIKELKEEIAVMDSDTEGDEKEDKKRLLKELVIERETAKKQRRDTLRAAASAAGPSNSITVPATEPAVPTTPAPATYAPPTTPVTEPMAVAQDDQ